MMVHRIEILCAISMLLGLCPVTNAFDVFPVWTTPNVQETPDVDNGIVVWAELVEGDWDVYGIDLLDPAAPQPIYVAAYAGFDQVRPAIWNYTVVWQDNELGDWDIWLTDIADAGNPVDYHISPYESDQTNPAIHGNTVVWQDQFAADDWDIYGADIAEPNDPYVYLVQLADENQYYANQQAPSLYRNHLVWQDNGTGDWDIASADLWLKKTPLDELLSASNLPQENPVVWGDWVVWQEDFGAGDVDIYAADLSDPADPVEFPLVGDTAAQTNPDISGHLVVWQDNRNGNWDIYGYNLITGEEFQITTHSADQTNPAISGSLVTWEDSRVTPVAIYYTWLDGDVIASCPDKLAGDIDRNCRVDLMDFSLMAQDWLVCALDPVSACTN